MKRAGPGLRSVLALALCGSLAAGARPVRAGAEPPAAPVTAREGRLSAEFVDVPLGEALAEVARVLGIRVQGLDHTAGRVTLTVGDAEIEDVVRRLLRGRSYVLVHAEGPPAAGGSGSRLVEIILVSPRAPSISRGAPRGDEGDPSPALERVAAIALSAPDPPARIAAIEALAGRGRSERSRARVRETLSAALADADEAVRAAALELLGRDADVPVATILGVAVQDGSPALRRSAFILLGSRPGDEAQRALHLALADPDPLVQDVGAAVLAASGARGEIQSP